MFFSSIVENISSRGKKPFQFLSKHFSASLTVNNRANTFRGKNFQEWIRPLNSNYRGLKKHTRAHAVLAISFGYTSVP